jgi:hypothetical protein
MSTELIIALFAYFFGGVRSFLEDPTKWSDIKTSEIKEASTEFVVTIIQSAPYFQYGTYFIAFETSLSFSDIRAYGTGCTVDESDIYSGRISFTVTRHSRVTVVFEITLLGGDKRYETVKVPISLISDSGVPIGNVISSIFSSLSLPQNEVLSVDGTIAALGRGIFISLSQSHFTSNVSGDPYQWNWEEGGVIGGTIPYFSTGRSSFAIGAAFDSMRLDRGHIDLYLSGDWGDLGGRITTNYNLALNCANDHPSGLNQKVVVLPSIVVPREISMTRYLSASSSYAVNSVAIRSWHKVTPVLMDFYQPPTDYPQVSEDYFVKRNGMRLFIDPVPLKATIGGTLISSPVYVNSNGERTYSGDIDRIASYDDLINILFNQVAVGHFIDYKDKWRFSDPEANVFLDNFALVSEFDRDKWMNKESWNDHLPQKLVNLLGYSVGWNSKEFNSLKIGSDIALFAKPAMTNSFTVWPAGAIPDFEISFLNGNETNFHSGDAVITQTAMLNRYGSAKAAFSALVKSALSSDVSWHPVDYSKPFNSAIVPANDAQSLLGFPIPYTECDRRVSYLHNPSVPCFMGAVIY